MACPRRAASFHPSDWYWLQAQGAGGQAPCPMNLRLKPAADHGANARVDQLQFVSFGVNDKGCLALRSSVIRQGMPPGALCPGSFDGRVSHEGWVEMTKKKTGWDAPPVFRSPGFQAWHQAAGDRAMVSDFVQNINRLRARADKPLLGLWCAYSSEMAPRSAHAPGVSWGPILRRRDFGSAAHRNGPIIIGQPVQKGFAVGC